MSNPIILSTEHLPAGQRREWLREVIGREYANVEITPPTFGRLFNEMTIHPWGNLRLSSIRSNAITIERLPREPEKISQDAYFAVVLLSGDYSLQQDGREVVLRPGDMTIYDATRPHRIFCPGRFSKLILSIPRSGLRERIVGVEHCSALRIPGDRGAGAVTAAFLTACAEQAGDLSATQVAALSENCLDLLAISLSTVRPAAAAASRGRPAALARIKSFVERNLADPNLDPEMVATGVGMSTRYINDILSDDDASLMRYVLGRRLEKCRRDLAAPVGTEIQITDVAFRWGFNDLSHFSRSFKEKFGCSPRDYKNLNLDLTYRVSK